MKRVCYERGAEDNLTAVLVRVGGDAASRSVPADDDEQTIIRERPDARSAGTVAGADSARTLEETPSPFIRRPFDDGPAARDAARAAVSETSIKAAPSSNVRAAQGKKRSGALGIVVSLLLVVGAAALAFYVGMMYERKALGIMPQTGPTPATGVAFDHTPASDPSPASEPVKPTFEERRAAVDRSPASEAERMNVDAGGQPLASEDPEFLYLYGRALLLTDRQQAAVAAFDRAIQKAGEHMTPRNGELKIDARLAKVAAQMRNGDSAAATEAARELDEVIRSQQQQPTMQTGADGGTQPSPGATP